MAIHTDGNGQNFNNWAMFCHAASFAGYFIPLASLIAPLVIWLMKKNESDFVDRHGKAAINFQITVLIGVLISIPLILIFVGFITLLIIAIASIIFTIINMIKASDGLEPHYPWCINFIK